MSLCITCITLGYCRRVQALLVTDTELNNSSFLRDVKAYAASLNITPTAWVGYLTDEYMKFPGTIVDHGNVAHLNMDVFEVPEDDLFSTNEDATTDHDAEIIRERLRDWFKTFCQTCAPGVSPRLRPEARERVRVMATILRARNPQATALWGRMDAANDNESGE